MKIIVFVKTVVSLSEQYRPPWIRNPQRPCFFWQFLPGIREEILGDLNALFSFDPLSIFPTQSIHSMASEWMSWLDIWLAYQGFLLLPFKNYLCVKVSDNPYICCCVSSRPAPWWLPEQFRTTTFNLCARILYCYSEAPRLHMFLFFLYNIEGLFLPFFSFFKYMFLCIFLIINKWINCFWIWVILTLGKSIMIKD